jgi:hypothetical protein
MTRIIAALLAAATIAGIAAPAAAQTKYFARERIVGMPATTPATTPPPASGYTTCTGMNPLRQPSGGTAVIVASNISTPADAQTACNTWLAGNKVTASGFCYHVKNKTGNAYNEKAVWFAGATIAFASTTDYSGALCTK